MFVGRSITVIRAHYSSPSTNHCRQQHLMPLTSRAHRKSSRLHCLPGWLSDWLLPQKLDWPADSESDWFASLWVSNSLSAICTSCLLTSFPFTILLCSWRERRKDVIVCRKAKKCNEIQREALLWHSVREALNKQWRRGMHPAAIVSLSLLKWTTKASQQTTSKRLVLW